MKHSRTLASFLTPALITASLFAAAQEQKPTLNTRTAAQSITLPVAIRDKRGNLMPNADKSDFTLTQDGRPQVIDSLARSSAEPFHVGLLVETTRGMMDALESERKAATQFVDAMLPADSPATDSQANQIFLLHFDREVELLRDLTDSRDKLHADLESMGPTSHHRDDRDGPETYDDQRERPRGGLASAQLYDAIYLASSEVLKHKPGVRNVLIVFSDGADSGSKVSLNEAMDAADKANAVIYTVYLKSERAREAPTFGRNDRSGGIGSGYPGGGGGYPGGGSYPGGGGYPGGSTGRDEKPSIDGRKIMSQIAKRTGGRYFETRKKGDLDDVYGIIVHELQGQYLLTYTPDKLDTEDDYHKVVLTPKKDDVTVDLRLGFFAPGADSK